MKKIYYSMVFFLMFACSTEEQSEEINDLLPGLFNLIYPENGSACLDGSVINDTQSKVTFMWGSSQNANHYEIEIVNLNDNYTQKFRSNEKTYKVVLKHGEPYAWSVTSVVNSSSSITSKEWKFYLAGSGEINYAPFPPELITPRPSARVNLNSDDQVIFNWSSSDVDDDLETYELFLDQTNASTLVKTLTNVENSVELGVELEAGFTYYWKIVATDSEGNSSSSGVYSFITE